MVDYSKFTWIYFIKNITDVFQAFMNFQRLVDPKFNKKNLIVKSDWGGEYFELNSFFQTQGIAHHVYCPHFINKTVPLKENIIILWKLD